MYYLIVGFICLTLITSISPSFASEISSVEPDFIKMRHSAEVKVKIKNMSENLHLSLIPGGSYVNKIKDVSKTSIIHDNLLIEVEEKSQVIIYQAAKSAWQEIGFIDITQPVSQLFWANKTLFVTTKNEFIEIDMTQPSSPNILSRRGLPQTIKNFSQSQTHDCTLSSKNITLNDKNKTQPLTSHPHNGEIPQLQTFNQYCVSLSEKKGIQVWGNIAGKLSVISQYATDNISRDIIIEKNVIAIADGVTGITLLSISPKGSLRWLGSYNKLGNIIHVAYSDNHLIAADDKGVLSVFDISEPAAPLLISDFHTHLSINAIQLKGKQSYILANSQIHNVDFSSNSSPMISTLGVNQGGSRRSFIHNDILYVADWFSGLHLYDIRIPAAPRLLSTFHTPGSPKGVVVRDGVAFVADDDHGLQIINVSNPLSPAFISELPLSGLAYTMKLIDNLLYIASHRGGFHIVDVSKPEAPALISTYDTAGKAWALEYQDGLLYVADDTSGLLIFNVTNPAQPQLINQFNPDGFAEDIILKDNKAYLAFFDLGLYIMDITNPLDIKQLAHLQTPGNARGIEIKKDLLYLASWEAGVQIIDISNETKPNIVGHYDTKGAVWGLSVENDYVYAMDWWGGIKILDASNTEKPILLSQYQTAGLINDLLYHNKFIYTAHGSRGLQVYDASNDLNPVWATGVDFTGAANAVTINGNLAIVAAGDGGIVITDISNPFQSKLIGQLKLSASISFVQSKNNVVFAAEENGDLFIIDIFDPTKPRLRKRISSTVNALTINGDKLYVLQDKQSLIEISVNNLANIKIDKRHELPNIINELRFFDESHLVLLGKNQLTPCSISDGKLKCGNDIKLPTQLLAMHIANNKLYVTAQNNALYVFTIATDNSLQLNTIYPTSHNIKRISSSKDGIFFGGESIIASGKLLPHLSIETKNDHASIKIPSNMPKGAYHLALTQADGSQSVKKNAVIIGFPKLKSKFTLEQLKAKMKQKNFEGKAPAKP
ncbi:MAG: hypothetical protein OEM38_03200 [Gammaproteobacteria bacterium]|nr:hypothetical protein [Gammaproteobacteria bacterium]